MKLSYTKKLYYKSIAKLLIVPAIMLVLAPVFLYEGIESTLALGIPVAAIIGFAIGFVFYPINLRGMKMMDRIVDPVYEKLYEGPLTETRDSAKRGMEGEKIVQGWLNEIIPYEGWYILANIERRNGNGKKFDIDTVVVGSKGVFVFEIKNSSYNYFFTTEDCAVVVGNQIRPFSGTDPRLQVGRNAETLEKLLKENNLPDIRTKRAVIFARPDSFRFLGSPAVYLIDNKETLRKFIMEFPDDPEFNFERCKKIADLLK